MQSETVTKSTEAMPLTTTTTPSPALNPDVKINSNSKPSSGTTTTAKPMSELPGALPIHSKVCLNIIVMKCIIINANMSF